MKPDTEDKHSQGTQFHELELINDIGQNVVKQLAEPLIEAQLKADATVFALYAELAEGVTNRKLIEAELCTHQPYFKTNECILGVKKIPDFKHPEHKTINNYQVTNNHNHHYYRGKDQNVTKPAKEEKGKGDAPTKSVYMILGLLIKELGYYDKYDRQGRKGGQEATINHIRDLAKEYGLPTDKNLSKATLHRHIKEALRTLEASKEDWE